MTSKAKKSIADANKAELLEFAQINLGLEVSDRMTREQLVVKIKAAGHTASTITVDAADPLPDTDYDDEPDDRPVIFQATDIPATGEMVDPWTVKVRINIPAANDPLGRQDVFVAVNGREALIQRGVDVELPLPYVLALKDASIISYPRDREGQMVDDPILLPVYPFSVIHAPDTARRVMAEHDRRMLQAMRL